jgi:hydrogenase/urease accessory protein HupE
MPHPLVFFLGFVAAGLLLHMAAGNSRFNDEQKAKLEAIARAWGMSPDKYVKFCEGQVRLIPVVGLVSLAVWLIFVLMN